MFILAAHKSAMAISANGKAHPERRRSTRAALRVAAAMRVEGGSELGAQLIDISTHGCRVECSSELAAGDRLWLEVAGLDAHDCRVVWRCEEFAGLEFEKPLAESALDKLLRDQAQLPAAGIGELRGIAARTHGLARKASDSDIPMLAELSRACAVDALVEGLRLGEARPADPDEPPPA